MLHGSLAAATAAGFVWGLLSVALSPCHLASIALLVGHIGRSSPGSGRKAGAPALLFGVGILVILAAIGAITAGLERIMGDTGPAATIVVGSLVIVFGVYLTDLVPIPMPRFTPRQGRIAGAHLQALLLGLVYGVALGPCSFAFLAPMIAVAFEASRADPLLSVAMSTAYAAGHTAVIVLAGTLAGAVGAYLKRAENTRFAVWARRVLGIVVAAVGVYLIVSAVS